MKNLLLTINIVLIALVAYLYYLHFSGKKSDAPAATSAAQIKKTDANVNVPQIAYINMDSLQNKYKYYQKIKADIEKKQNDANNEIMSLQKKFQARATDLQKKAATMSPQEQETAMNEINKMQQDFQTRKQNLDNELFNFNSRMKENILSKIEDYLKDFNKDGRYAYVFSYEPGFMFYKDSTLDITPAVVKGLNETYEEKKN